MSVSALSRRCHSAPLTLVHIERNADINGNTGTGIVAEGVIFTSGKVVIQWLHEISSIVTFDCIEDLLAIHGHNGKTVVIGNP